MWYQYIFRIKCETPGTLLDQTYLNAKLNEWIERANTNTSASCPSYQHRAQVTQRIVDGEIEAVIETDSPTYARTLKNHFFSPLSLTILSMHSPSLLAPHAIK